MRRLLALALLLWPLTASAQQQALIADQLRREGSLLIAEGDVSFFSDGYRITAPRIVHDRATERSEVTGPLRILAPDGTVTEAESGEMSHAQNESLLRAVRVTINQQLQITATTLRREGENMGLTHAAMTSCHTCPGKRPLWEIRSESVIYSEDAERIWLRSGSFHIKGIPVFWTPSISFPAPGVARARGLLRPGLKRIGEGNYAIVLPWFLPLGDHADLTVTPVLSRQTPYVGLRYRQAFSRGTITLTSYASPASRTGLKPGAWMRLSGAFSLPQNWRLSGDFEAISRQAYMRDFNIDTRSQLDHALQLEQILPRSRTRLNYTRYVPLKSDNGTRSHIRNRFDARLDLRRAALGGFVYGRLRGKAYDRDMSYASNGTITQSRLAATAGWRGRAILGPGFEASAQGFLRADAFAYQIKGGISTDGQRQSGGAAASLAWPLRGQGLGMSHLITPRLTASWTSVRGDDPANDSIHTPELDEISLHRFTNLPGETRLTSGARLGMSLNWEARDAAGRAHYLSFGRLLQQTPPADAAASTGLATRRSDWTLALGSDGAIYDFDSRFAFGAGGLIRSDLRAGLTLSRANLSLAHSFMTSDSAIGRTQNLSLFSLSGGWQVLDGLRLAANGSYDMALREPRAAKIGMNWNNECLRMSLSASHTFASSVTAKPKTEYGFEISIDGFSTNAGPAPLRSCRN